MVIDEIGEIAAHLKLKMEKYSPRYHPFTLEFTLHTADGDYLPVEMWVVWLDPEHVDENMNLHKVFYPQLSTLLKSVLMASRFTPIYRHYARRQDVDSFVLLYKVSVDHPDVSVLGEDRRYRQLGNLPTPYGALRMDLYYRTKMEILPSEIPAEDMAGSKVGANFENKIESSQIMDIYGNVLPAKGSDVMASSPALEDVNRFSTSPLDSEDFPLADSLEDVDRASFNLGRSSMTAATDEGRPGAYASMRYPSGDSIKFETHASPGVKPNSFPQRAACRQMRIRNNSFPFASLLVMDLHGSSDQFRSQILPKVPEDVAVNGGGLHVSSSDRVLCDFHRDTARGQRKKRHSSLTGEAAAFAGDTHSEPVLADETRHNNFHLHRDSEEEEGVVGLEMDSSQQRQNSEQQAEQQKGTTLDPGNKNQMDGSFRKGNNAAEESEDDDDRHSCSSDDSYVKVVPFASDYSDLTDFAQEVHVAPRDLASSFQESAADLSKQIDEFREKATAFDDFVASLRDLDENNTRH